MRLFTSFAAALTLAATLVLTSFGTSAAVLTFDDLSAPTAALPGFDYGGLTPITPDETEAEAEARMQRLMAALLPKLPKFIPE